VKKHLLLLLTIVIAISTFSKSAKAQSIELFAGNTLNGAMNGVLLGGATMALKNSDEFGPVRVGLGAGTLYGIGMGVYDVTRVSKGQQFYISGTFNDGTNTSIIILLDTIYGAAGGAIVASSVSLILKDPLGDALQYGAGTGAWIGFGFGIADAFIFSDGPNFSQKSIAESQNNVNGLLTYSNSSNSLEVGMINPKMIKQKKISNTSVTTNYTPSLGVIQLKVNL
jgi:hypothetical protein